MLRARVFCLGKGWLPLQLLTVKKEGLAADVSPVDCCMVRHIFHIIAAARCDKVAVQCCIHNVILTYLPILHSSLS